MASSVTMSTWCPVGGEPKFVARHPTDPASVEAMTE
jgi:hypothetical protein